MSEADARFYFDPVCPFAWMTSKWVRVVQEQRGYAVDWRFISLRMVNADVDYDTHFPPGYVPATPRGCGCCGWPRRRGTGSGPTPSGALRRRRGADLRLRARPGAGRSRRGYRGTRGFVKSILADADLAADLADALDDETFDALIQRETDEALALTGQDVGTPIIQFGPPDGMAFFGPVISRLPSAADAVQLWDHVAGLAAFPGFAELKRSLREMPQLRAFGAEPGRQP